jgi:hypothetical protein
MILVSAILLRLKARPRTIPQGVFCGAANAAHTGDAPLTISPRLSGMLPGLQPERAMRQAQVTGAPLRKRECR